MKKVVNQIVLLTLLVVPILTYSQVRFGIRGSIHRTNISDIHRESEGRTAGAIGGLALIPIGQDNMFFFQPEIVYSLEGEKDEGNRYGIPRNTKYFQNYVNIPLLFKAYFSEDDNEFFGELGPTIGILVYQKNKDKDLEIYNDKPKSYNVTIGAGVGYSFLRRYEVAIRYNYGLMDLYKANHGQQRTSNLALSFAYVFD